MPTFKLAPVASTVKPFAPTAHAGQTAKLTLITPQIAEHFLKDNLGNRRPRPSWAAAISRMILRGEFVTTHQGVAFCEDGTLLDGQHRLQAIILSGTPVWMWVFHGLPLAAKGVMDVGLKRNHSDITGLPQKAAEVVRYLTELAFGGNNATAGTMAHLIDAGFADRHEELMMYSAATAKIFSTTPVRAAALLLVVAGHDEHAVFASYKRLVTKDFENFTPQEAVFFRQQDSLSGTNKPALLARGLLALDPQRAELQGMKLPPDKVLEIQAGVRADLRALLGLGQEEGELA